MAFNERLYLEQRRTDYHGRIGCSIYPADMGRDVLDSEVVWMRLTRDEILAMLAAAAMIYIATEVVIWAITGAYIGK